MKFAAGAALVIAFIATTVSGFAQRQQIRIPDEYFTAKAPFRPSAERMTAVSPSLHKTAPHPTADVLIGSMCNSYTTQSRLTDQIDYDPFTNTLAVVYRRAYPDHSIVGELTYRYSTDYGATWTAESPTVNIGVENPSGLLIARHPNITLVNASKSTDRAQLGIAMNWANLVALGGSNVFGEVGFAAGPIDGAFTKGKWRPNPPNYSIPCVPVLDRANGNLYTVVEGIDPSTGNTIGEQYLGMSTDGGQSWTINSSLPILSEPVNGAQSIFSPTIDISPDGTTMYVAFMAVTVSNNQYTIADPSHRLAFIKSTDGGATWSSPTFLGLPSLNVVGVEMDKLGGWIAATTAVVVDAQNTPHFLITAQSDTFFPLDSSFVGEVTPTPGGSGWDFFPLAYCNSPYVWRFMSSQNYLFYNEPEWAKTVDGNRIFAKWIDTDSSLAYKASTQTYVRDTLHNIYMTGKDIRSNNEARGWISAINVSNTPTIDEKQTKMAHTVGDDQRLYPTYTLFANAESADDDDLGVAKFYLVPNVQMSQVVTAVDRSDRPGEFALSQNYPNPFNPSTTIAFTLPEAARTKLTVHDALGRRVATIVDGRLDAGAHNETFNASDLPSGVYLYRLESGSHVATRVMTLVK